MYFKKANKAIIILATFKRKFMAQKLSKSIQSGRTVQRAQQLAQIEVYQPPQNFNHKRDGEWED